MLKRADFSPLLSVVFLFHSVYFVFLRHCPIWDSVQNGSGLSYFVKCFHCFGLLILSGIDLLKSSKILRNPQKGGKMNRVCSK